MSIKLGHRGYLFLSTEFEAPRWREAVVIGLQKEWVQTLVRASTAEVNSLHLSSCQVREEVYALVEAKASQLRSGVLEDFLKLNAENKVLLPQGSKLLDSSEETLNFATASDPDPGSKEKKDTKPASQSSSQSGSSSDQKDQLDKIRKQWLDGGTGSEKDSTGTQGRSKKGKRFALISKKSRRSQKDALDESTKSILENAAKSQDPLHGLLALQLSQSLRKASQRRKGRGRRREASASASSTSRGSSDSTGSSGSPNRRGHAKAVANYQASKKKMHRNPLRYVKRYVDNIEKEMGCQERGFRVTDYTKKIPFGKQRGLQRCHYLFGIVLELLLQEKPERAALQVVLNLQAIHQAALDQDWSVGWLLTHVPDPYERRLWGGDPAQLQEVATYVKSMQDLQKNTEALRRRGKADQDEADEKKGNGKGKKNGKNGKSDKDKEKEQE